MTRKALTLLAVLLLSASAASAEVVEAIVARVGDRIITRSQYQNRLRDGYSEIDKTSKTPADVEERKKKLKDQLLQDMLDELLIKDRADRLGITVSDAELRDAIERLKKQYNIEDDKQFDESLKQAGLTRSVMESRLRDTLLTNKVFARELRSRSELTDKELKARYELEKEQYRLPERADLREIVFTIQEGSSGATAAERKKLAEDVAQKARAGEDFAALAKQYSDSATKSDGGKLGTVTKGELIHELDGPVFQATEGDILGPIETRFGYDVLKVEKRLPSEIPGFEEVKEKLRQNAGEEVFNRDYKAYVENLKKEAFVVIFKENIPG